MTQKDELIIESSGNVFVDLGFDPIDAEIMKLRTEFMLRTRERIKELGLTQVEAAEKLNITEPRVSSLLQGKIDDFSLELLFTLAARSGLKPAIYF